MRHFAARTQDAFFDATAAQDHDLAGRGGAPICRSSWPSGRMQPPSKSTNLVSKCSFIYKINLPECALEKIFLVG